MKRSAPLRRSKRIGPGKYARSEWRTLRARVLRRDKGWCQVCDNAEATEVHHRTYGRGNGVKSLLVPMEDLVSVCRRCHAGFHPWMEG